MIPDEAKNQFQDIITDEMLVMDESLARVLDATIRSMNARGLLGSGLAMQTLTEDATNALKSRANFILGQLLRCLASHHVALNTETVAEALTLLQEAIETQAQIVRGRLFGNPGFATNSLEQAKQQLMVQYNQVGPRLISRLSTELKLAAAASHGSSSQSAPSLNFHGPVWTRSNWTRESSHCPPTYRRRHKKRDRVHASTIVGAIGQAGKQLPRYSHGVTRIDRRSEGRGGET
jgi:hypothetical protein